jgi:hypothetical protein
VSAAAPAPAGPRALAAPLAVALATLAFQLPFFDRWFSVMDEGHLLLFADLIQQGGQLYRDATCYPLPGAFYLLSAAFQLFGTSIGVSRWLVCLEFAAFAALGFSLLRRLVPVSWAWAGVALLWLHRAWAFPHWQIYSYSTTALLFQLASLLLLCRHLERGGMGALRGAGLLFGIGVFCKQDYGAAALLAACATLWVASRAEGGRAPRCAAEFVGAGAAVGLLAALHFAWQGQLERVVQQTVLNHFIGMSSYTYPGLPSLWPLFRQDPALRELGGVHQWVPGLIVAAGSDWKSLLESPLYLRTPLYDVAVKLGILAPWLWLGVLGWRQWRMRAALRSAETRGRALQERALFHFAAALLALGYLVKPQDYVHLVVLTSPLLLASVPWLHDLLAPRPRARRAAQALGLVAGLATAWLLYGMRVEHSEPLPGARAGVYAKPGQARMLGELVAYVRETSPPGRAVGAMPYLPIALFLAERFAPHPASYIVWPFPEYPDRDRRILDALEAQQTALVLYNFTQFPSLPPMEDSAPELYAYLVDHYEVERVFSESLLGLRVAALRRADPPGGAPLLTGPRDGEIFAESYDGSRQRVATRERGNYLAREVWPFRPVLALRPLPYGARSVLSLPLRVPAGARLESAVGVHPDAWFHIPTSATTFEVRARDGADTAVLFSRTLDPQRVLEDRGWFPFEVDLAAYAGREIVLELSTAASDPSGASLRMGGFAEPILVQAAPGAARSEAKPSEASEK